MKASDSTNSLTGLTQQIEVQVDDLSCFICLDVLNEKEEPLVDSSLLRTCGCQFKVHPACWNEWMKDKTDYDCPICRKTSLRTNKSPVPPLPVGDWPSETETRYRRAKICIAILVVVFGGAMILYELVKG